MKNIFKYTLLAFLSLTMISCDEDATEGKFGDNPESGWVDFNVATSGTTLSAIATELIVPIQVNAPVNATDLTVNFTLEEILGGSPTQVISSSNRSVVIPGGSLDANIVLEVADLLPLISNGITVEFDIVLATTNRGSVSVGLSDDSQVTRFRVSTPCPVDLTSGTVYSGSSSQAGSSLQSGYPVTLTEVGPLTYTIDTSYGPNFVSILSGAAYDGQFLGALTFTVDPLTGDITILQGGSTDGSDNQFGAAYTVTGSGSYDTCNDVFLFSLVQAGVFANDQPADVVLERP